MAARTLALSFAALLLGACAGSGSINSGGVPAGEPGSTCTARADCHSGLSCLTGSSGFPDGICASSCQSASCATGSQCVDVTDAVGAKACLPTCSATSDCRAGYVCCGGACTPNLLCNAPITGGDGGPQDGGHGDAGPDAGQPDAGGQPDGGGSDAGVVFRTCTPPSTASTWHVVNGGTVGPSSAPSGCQTPIRTSALPSGQVQSLGQHNVGDSVQFNVPAGTGTVSIISQAVGTPIASITYNSQAIPNSVVPGTVTASDSTSLYDDSANPPADGATAHMWYQGLSPVTGAMTFPNSTQGLSDAHPAGSWTMTVNDYAYECPNITGCSGGGATGRYDITVVTKPVAPSTGTVDIGIYIASSSFNASTAVSDANVARFLKTLAVIYGRTGLCLGTITFYDLPAWAKARYATGVDATKTTPCDNLDQMFSLSLPGNTLNFFFVDSIAQNGSTSGGTIVGIDGTIPGPSSVGGTVHSGAVVNSSDLGVGQSVSVNCSGAPAFGNSLGTGACGPDVTAYITAHEGGHWMGLYHTTEAPGSYYDPVADTPKCTCSTACLSSTNAGKCLDPKTGANGSNPYLLTGGDCSQSSKPACQGADDLMFWLLDSHSVGNFSTQQGQIVRANPVVQ